MPRYRLAYLVTHPIQYQAPLLRTIAAEPELDLRVFFCSDFSVGRFEEAEFGREIEWDVPLLDGIRHHFVSDVPVGALCLMPPGRLAGARAGAVTFPGPITPCGAPRAKP